MLDRLRKRDDGFSLVEILVALTVFALMTMAAVPLVVTGLRASTVAKLDTGAKNLAQERMESMRNLPYHISAQTGVATSTDLLDVYYPTVTTASGPNAAGFIAAGASRRPGEPAGALYRTVWNLTSDMGPYTQFVAIQFLDPDGSPTAPPSDWSRVTANKDLPPSLRVGVTVTTEWWVGDLTKRLTVATQMGEGRGDPPIVTVTNRTTALKITSTLVTGTGPSDLVFEAGSVSLDGSLTTGTSAASSATAGYAALNPGSRTNGATAAAMAPPSTPTPLTASVGSGQQLPNPNGGSALVGFGVTRVQGVAASTAFGLPSTGSSTAPVRAALEGGNTLSFTNGPVADSLPGISASAPVVSVINTDNSADQVDTSGWSSTTAGTGQSTRTTTSAVVRKLAVLPTSFATQGLFQVALRESSAQCLSSAASTTASVTYAAEISYWAHDKGDGLPGYVPLAGNGGRMSAATPPVPQVSSDDTTNALAALLEEDPLVAEDTPLSTYFTAMSSQTGAGLAAAVSTQDRRIELDVPAVLSFTTAPLRGDAGSAVSLDLGVFSCVAEDRR